MGLNTWHHVTSTLPEEYTPVLVRVHDTRINHRHMDITYMTKGNTPKGPEPKRWLLEMQQPKWRVTHWMPLPEAPEGET